MSNVPAHKIPKRTAFLRRSKSLVTTIKIELALQRFFGEALVMDYVEYLEFVLRILLGLQCMFWGLNGFFNWVKIPPTGPVIEAFVSACYQTKFIMPSVKFLEIILGFFLVIGLVVPASLLGLAPIVFVITGLHLMHNPKPGRVLMPFSLPYAILLFIHSLTWLRLF